MKKQRIIFLIILMIVAVGGVFGVLYLGQEKLDYVGAIKISDEILSKKQEVIEFWRNEYSSDEVAPTQESIEQFVEDTKKIGESCAALSESTVLKNAELKQKYEDLQEGCKKIEGVGGNVDLLGDFVKLDGDMDEASEVAGRLRMSENELLRNLGGDLEEYIQKVADFQVKYDGKTSVDDYESLIAEQRTVVEAGNNLNNKYAQVKTEEIMMIAIENVEDWFARVLEFRSVLEQKQ